MLKVNGKNYDWGDVDVKFPGLVLVVQEISYDEVAAKLGELEAAIGKSDEEAVHILESAVPTYHHTKNCA